VKGNAEDGYEQSLWESLLLTEGWRFRGMPVLSTGPWKARVFFAGVVLIVVAAVVYADVVGGVDPGESVDWLGG
jgi:hypothetical protein